MVEVPDTNFRVKVQSHKEGNVCLPIEAIGLFLGRIWSVCLRFHRVF